jgi:hypothetical protein
MSERGGILLRLLNQQWNVSMLHRRIPWIFHLQPRVLSNRAQRIYARVASD